MTKRKPGQPSDSINNDNSSLQDLGLDLNETASGSKPQPSHFRFKKFKNSLDSDEDDDEDLAKSHNVLDPDDLEGQEEHTIDRDGEIRITPFNMKDELEEGHFDKEGTFIFKKNDEIKDHWLDNIDWVKIKERKEPMNEDSSDSDAEPINYLEIHQEMLLLMQPKESILKAIKRLGGNSKPPSSRWNKKLQKEEESETDKENREKLVRLTALADKLLGTGDMDIYQQTYEKLSFLVKSRLKNDEEAADMFGDDFDAAGVATADSERASMMEEAKKIEMKNEVMWEFKWEDKDDAPVYGPHPSSEMLRWVEEGYFSDGVLVRKVNEPNARFYSSNRIDFDLYT